MSKLMVVDNIGSFSLVPYFKEKFDGEIYSMSNLFSREMWEIFKRVSPDVVFVDFANENAVNMANLAKEELSKKPKIIVRLHGYEAQSELIKQVDWNHIDHLIVVSPKFEEIVKSKVGDAVQVHVVPNGIDFDKFKLQNAEEISHEDWAYAGYLNKKKGPTLLRTVVKSMKDKQFHIAGSYQDEHVRLYMECADLPNAKFYGWVDTGEFLTGKGFILSTSVTESFGMSIAEGMAMGLTPAVHHWPGAELIWPEKYVWETFDDLKNISLNPMDPNECRAWVEERYSMENCIESVMSLF
jgi:glycosyltransferase involved in cell wall biosynthesis